VRAVAGRRELRHGADRGVRAGTPVVASDIAGYRDVVRDGVDGVLVPPGDAQALAEALRDLYDEPERRASWRGPRPRRPAVRLAAGRAPR
jgi:glycosyltransferase involved in cell wall biosynthesis